MRVDQGFRRAAKVRYDRGTQSILRCIGVMSVRGNASVLDIRDGIERTYALEDWHRNGVRKGECWNYLRVMD